MFESKKGPRNVTILGSVVSKQYVVGVELEYEKALALWETSSECGFIAPRPRCLDVNKKTVLYDYIDNFRSIRTAYIEAMTSAVSQPDALAIIRSAGKTLGKIHQRMMLQSGCRWTPTEQFITALRFCKQQDLTSFLKRSPCAHMHCDFGFSNVGYRTVNGEKKIVVLDASPNHFTTFHTNCFGTIYLDIGNFLGCIDGRVRLYHYPKIRWHHLPFVKESFIVGYEESSGIEIDRQWANMFAYCSVYCYFSRKFPWAVSHKLAMWLVYNAYKGNAP